MAEQQIIIRVVCGKEGHEGDWVEFDTSAWTLADYREMYYASLPECLQRWVEKDSTSWLLTGPNSAAVAHPGRGAARSLWLAAYRQLGDEGLALAQWLALSSLIAINQRMENAKKSSDGSAPAGAGGSGPGAAGDSDGAAG